MSQSAFRAHTRANRSRARTHPRVGAAPATLRGAGAPERAEVPADEPGSSALSLDRSASWPSPGPISFILFMLCGLAFGGWYWSWIFFMIPGVLYRWFHANDEN